MDDRKPHRSWIRVASLILFLTFASALAFGDSLSMVLTSSGGGEFRYAISTPFGTTSFATNQTIALTGLSDVTGATSLLDICFTSSFASSSATLTAFHDCAFGGRRFNISALEVSSLAPLGTIHFAIESQQGNFSGTVAGPTIIPEPSSLLMLDSVWRE